MKLQTNTSGAWRDLISFAPADEPVVRTLATELARLAERKIALRIASPQNIALAICRAPDFTWTPAQ